MLPQRLLYLLTSTERSKAIDAIPMGAAIRPLPVGANSAAFNAPGAAGVRGLLNLAKLICLSLAEQ